MKTTIMRPTRSLAIIVYLALIVVSETVVGQTEVASSNCDDMYEAKSHHWWCENQAAGAWTRNVDCKWASRPIQRNWQDCKPASGTLRCSQSAPCSMAFEIQTSREVRNHFQVGFKVGAELPNGITAELSVGSEKTVTDKASRKSSFTCSIRPGYEADVWMCADMMKLTGKIYGLKKEWDIGIYRPGSYRCSEFVGEMDIPIVDKNTNQLSGPLECRQRPMSDVGDVYFHKNDQRNLREGCELDAVNDALEKMSRTVPPMNQNVLATGSRCGQTVYVRAMCFNIDDPHSYQSRCSACIKYAKENILSKGKLSYGVNWRVKDCYLRYEFYHFT